MFKSDKTLHAGSCRICLDSQCNNMVKLDHQNGWLALFEYCFGISLSIQDTPQNLCRQCANNVTKYSKFKDLCFKSDKLWKSISNGKHFTRKVQYDKHVKDEIFDNEQDGNEIVTANEKNCTYTKEFNSDMNNYDDTDDIASITNKIEKVNNEKLKDLSEEGVITYNVHDKDMILLAKDRYLKHNPNTNINKAFNKNISRKVKDLFICKICEKKYGSKMWYFKHLKSCKLEEVNNSTGTEIKIHEYNKILKCKKTKKRQNFLHCCGVCKFSSNNGDDITKHLEGHWINNDLQCTLCEFIGKDQAAIAAHRYNHYAAKTSSFTCHICQKKTKSQLTLQFHYRKVHLNKIGGLCSQPQCDKAYNSWKLWKRHEKLHSHPGYICDFCGQKYRYKHSIVEHLANHVNPATYVCDVCGKTFLRLRNLRVHMENVHVKLDPLKCLHCGRMFKNQHYLRIHQKLLAMEKIWKCEFCPMEYPQLNLLNSHLKSHSDERPHCCHVCGSRYKAKSQLAIHIRNHTGDRPYKCSMCGKAFKSSQLLRRHTMIHTGIMPHKCLHCEKTFLCKKRLIKHCTMRHKSLDIICK
ncbi:unnamed protein product [Arctia plantaginis]|uniref:Uncharacterized protein n=1 Tax=Arctia plantaginis TaxID=874455 RepID=A0A8S0YVR1_ARCPL|nr:unnamed protein product [Arctia plantaginis]CAB3247485.1 unnamed protein product [Arctia plantaginis]